MSVDLASLGRSRKVVLAEGASDKAALEVLARRGGMLLGWDGICVLAMGGATSIGASWTCPARAGWTSGSAGGVTLVRKATSGAR